VAGAVAIEFFEVAPDEDEEFLAAWAAEGGGDLYRAVRDDVRCRFVAVTAGGDYELVREDGTGRSPVAWCSSTSGRTAGGAAGRRGYIGSRLYRGRRALCGDRVVVEPADGLPRQGARGPLRQSHSVSKCG
jgi:hypothetical protein